MKNEIRFQGGGKPVTTGFAIPQVHREDEPSEAVNDSVGSFNPADPRDKTESEGIEGANKGPKG
jgi:hypothetical protein